MKLYPGFAVGSENQWSLIQGELIAFFAQPLLANAVFNNPNWDWTTFNYDSDARLVDRVLAPKIDATSPNLSAIRQLGHKIIMTQGWVDQLNAQSLPIEYYDSVVLANDLGDIRRTADYFRLFMVPGMGHCGGGPGPSNFDAIGSLVKWVEQDIAPDTMLATAYVNGDPTQGVSMTRPLCPYPTIAKYHSGNTNQASSFVCVNNEAAYAKDQTQELESLFQNLIVGDRQNLPN